MNSQEIQTAIAEWAGKANFTAPYGVITGSHQNLKGKPYRAVTFGYARTLDCTVQIFNRNWIVITTNRHGTQAYKNYTEAMDFLQSLVR
jgi:hypothetical protein